MIRKIFLSFKKLYRRLIVSLFRLDKWHSSLYDERTYAQVVVNLANSTFPDTTLDIGCGMGEISARIKSRVKYITDKDENVLKYIKRSNFLRKPKYKTVTFINNITFDLAVMVNWTHNITELEFKNHIKILHNSTNKNGHIIFDVVKSEIHKYYHNEVSIIDGYYKILTVVGPFEYGRKIILARKI